MNALHKTEELSVDDIKQAIIALPMVGKLTIIEWLEGLGDELFWLTPGKASAEDSKPSNREVVEIRRIGAKVYQLEKVRCGKGVCKSCPHGPYWYGYQRRGKKVVSWYIGKDLKKEFQAHEGDRPDSPANQTPAGDDRC